MNGIIYLARGAGPHPTVLFLHGYPGNERNLDLAQAVRRAGYNAVYFDYRGAWGSGGEFGFANALEDVGAALDFLRNPVNSVPLRIDTLQLALLGHSMGGWLALLHAAADPRIACVGALAPWNVGLFGRTALAHPGDDAGAYFRQTTGPGAPIHGDATALLREAETHAAAWDYLALAPALHDRAVLLVAATRDDADEGDAMRLAMGRALARAGAQRVRSVLYDDDHPFSAHREELARLLVLWLGLDCAGAHRRAAG